MSAATVTTATPRIAVTYCPDQDARELLATWGPAVDRRLEEITARLQVELGADYEVDLDTSVNGRCSGATQELRVVCDAWDGGDHEQIVREALLEAWNHCSDRWNHRSATRAARRAGGR